MNIIDFWSKFKCDCSISQCEPKLHSIDCAYRVNWVTQHGSVHMSEKLAETLRDYLKIKKATRVYKEDDIDNSNDLDYASFKFNREADPYAPTKVKISFTEDDWEIIRNTKISPSTSKPTIVKENKSAGTGNYYVYIVKVDGQARYVGKGSGDRYKHASSGRSSSKLLNKAFFEGKDISVDIFARGLSSSQALRVEAEQILLLVDKIGLENIYNKVVPKA